MLEWSKYIKTENKYQIVFSTLEKHLVRRTKLFKKTMLMKVHKWFKRFINDSEVLNDEENLGSPHKKIIVFNWWKEFAILVRILAEELNSLILTDDLD